MLMKNAGRLETLALTVTIEALDQGFDQKLSQSPTTTVISLQIDMTSCVMVNGNHDDNVQSRSLSPRFSEVASPTTLFTRQSEPDILVLRLSYTQYDLHITLPFTRFNWPKGRLVDRMAQ